MREALLAIVRHAGEIIRRRENMVIEEKEGHANFVTTIDEGVQDYLRSRTRRRGSSIPWTARRT